MKVTRVGGRISRDRLPPGGQANHGWLAPRGATCPGGKINWDTGINVTYSLPNIPHKHCSLLAYAPPVKTDTSVRLTVM